MSFTAEDFQALIRLLEGHPEWQDSLRRLLWPESEPGLAEALAALATKVGQLAEAQLRTEARVEELAEAQRQTEARMAQLAEAQRRTEARLEALAARVDQLAAAQLRTEARVEELAEAQRRTEARLEELAQVLATLTEQVRRLTEAQQRTDVRLGRLYGREVERRYREYAPAYFAPLLRRLRLLSAEEVAALSEEAEERGVLSEDDTLDLKRADVVARGRRPGETVETYLVAEVSATVTREDVERALRRATLLRRASEQPVLAVVAGEQILAAAEAYARQHQVWRVLDGRALSPTEPASEILEG